MLHTEVVSGKTLELLKKLEAENAKDLRKSRLL